MVYVILSCLEANDIDKDSRWRLALKLDALLCLGSLVDRLKSASMGAGINMGLHLKTDRNCSKFPYLEQSMHPGDVKHMLVRWSLKSSLCSFIRNLFHFILLDHQSLEKI